MSLTKYFKSFVIALVLLIPSNYDVYTDYNLTYQFFIGDRYIFKSKNDSEFDTTGIQIGQIIEANCQFSSILEFRIKDGQIKQPNLLLKIWK